MVSKIRAFSAIVYIAVVIPFCIALMYCFQKSHRKIRAITAKVFIQIFGVKAQVFGEIDKEARILVMNHQSFMDVIYLEAMHPNNLCWIAKKELGKPFLYGHALKAPKMILIDRESKKEMVHLLKEAKDRLQNGRTLCIFPEGTRSLGGEKLLPFKSGAKVLTEHFGLKVQPVVFCGTRKCLDIGAMHFSNEAFMVKYLPSFVPEGEDWFVELKEKMQKEYTNLYSQLFAVSNS
ncbi:lysophospholipid acyltransferase family protein [Helicobacter canadensis]|uniref:1-acyl-sn-glycerol-3-phosphate acyltransferase n=1 Tax=Helicobacter canadensis MIT 98-5491 TaxID=537970 RepID=C5ZVH8_9HELI|nr:lysophospholipid acyltransferase family protein [Helicobacter canadensis]EES88852.1 1-acyl-sn-glycerol-3-phosphate acyltransferase [Helicobacter canadensis MIT 98-5491]EFR48846.1 Acyltransferase [Helicobacter canadensis MIT 98-5491]STP00119.1 1-acyl-sn-glycerol-3-phosphate acyltransferase [Helicobacter canadensis]